MVTLIAAAAAMSASSQAGDLEEALRTQLESVPRALPGLDSQLSDVARAAESSGSAAGIAEAQGAGLTTREQRVRVTVVAGIGSEQAAASAVESQGGILEARYEQLVQALVSPTALEPLAADPSVRYVRTPIRYQEAAVAGEGVAASNADTWHANGLRGSGATVAVIDGGFQSYTTKQASGDLPASLTTINFCADGFTTNTDHGTAVAEIVHEQAPDAQLALICAGTRPEAGLAKNWVKANGIKIVNFSQGDFFGRGDGSGDPTTSAGIAADAAASGILWVNAAGNHGDEHWSGSFSDPDFDGAHNFTGADEGNSVSASIPNGFELCGILRWDSWPTSPSNDFDLYLLNSSTATVLASSTSDQTDGVTPPYEHLCWTNPGPPQFVNFQIARFAGTGTPRFDFFAPGTGGGFLQYQVPAGSLAEPATSPSVLAVGAICWQNSVLQSYSSQGPNIAGVTKPDIGAPDAVSSATYGPASGCSGGFPGTSASSPHVAGAAALWKGWGPGLTRDDLWLRLTSNAVDLGTPGLDNLFGAGRLQLPDPPTSPGPQEPPPPPPPPPASGGGGGGGGGQAPDIELSKTASVTTARVGDTILYRIEARLKNVGLSSGASSVVVTDTLPAGVELVSTKVNRGPGCSGTTTITCPLDFISADVVGLIEIVVRVTTEGELVNVASASSVPADLDTSNNTARVTVSGPAAATAPPPSPEAVAEPAGVQAGVRRRGTARANTMRGTSFADFLYGLAGNDRLFGLAGDDRVFGGLGNDLLDGAAGNDLLDGGEGDDRLFGGAGPDLLTGGLGTDFFNGGADNDTIRARDGKAEIIDCGAGKQDAVIADGKDRVARNCEAVRRR